MTTSNCFKFTAIESIVVTSRIRIIFSDEILEDCLTEDVALLVVGDPFGLAFAALHVHVLV